MIAWVKIMGNSGKNNKNIVGSEHTNTHTEMHACMSVTMKLATQLCNYLYYAVNQGCIIMPRS